MGQDLAGLERSFLAGDTLTAYRIVQMVTGTANTVVLWVTATAYPIGVTVSKADSGTAIPVRLFGTAKIIAANSIASGVIVAPETGTGACITATANIGTTAARNIIGITLDNADALSAVEVLLQPQQTGLVTLGA